MSETRKKSLIPKKYYYWAEGDDEYQKYYFGDVKSFLQFLKENDPCLCGSDPMTDKEWKKIKKIGADNEY